MTDNLSLKMSDGEELVIFRWLPSGEPRAVVQVAHGAAEHAGRYGRLAEALNRSGYAVYADDHRGHGRTAGTPERAGIAGADSWNRLLFDQQEITSYIKAQHPGRPVLLLGHSMGSFLAQGYIQRWGDELAGVALSGSSGALSEEADGLAEKVAAAVKAEGRDAPSMDFAMLFVDFNDPFVDEAPADGPTGFEWLSRDADEVRKYVDDPWCGFPLSNGFVADMADALEATWSSEAEGGIPKSLPVLILSGERDPVAEHVDELVQRYRDAGLSVTDVRYAGRATRFSTRPIVRRSSTTSSPGSTTSHRRRRRRARAPGGNCVCRRPGRQPWRDGFRAAPGHAG